MSQYENISIRLSVIALTFTIMLLLTNCGGGGAASIMQGNPDPPGSHLADRITDPPAPSQDLLAKLESKLESELALIGKGISDTGSRAPSSGSEVIDLAIEVLDPDANGQLPPYGASLRWTEQLVGDYDMNGEVGFSDITPLAMFFGYEVVYLDTEVTGGVTGIPAGDPDDFGNVDPGMPPEADSGAFNWRLSRIDGNRDGEINLGDITPLAVHWEEVLTGYNLYRKGPNDVDFVLLENTIDPSRPSTISRIDVIDADAVSSGKVVPSYAQPDFFMLDTPDPASVYSYFVAPYNSRVHEEGIASLIVELSPFTEETLNDGIIPRIEATLLSEGEISVVDGVETIEAVLPAIVRFDASTSYVPDDMTPNYVWDFDGDGIYDYSSNENPVIEHIFEENARLATTVRIVGVQDDKGVSRTTSLISKRTNAIGGSQTFSFPLVIISPFGNIPPVAEITADDTMGSAPLTVNFDGSLSSDVDGEVVIYDWDFDGDGTSDFSSVSPAATYTYGQPGHYDVILRVVDDMGGSATDIISVIVCDEFGRWPPSASLIVFPATGPSPLNVSLNAQQSIDPDGQIVSYEWDLNGDFTFDINSGAQTELEYTFAESGVYNVWLKVTDSDGLFDLDRALINVNNPPYGGLEASPSEGSGPLTVEFDASSSQDLDGTIVTYEWDFDTDGDYDLNTGILSHTSHTYYTIGTMTCTVRLTDNLGGVAFATVNVEVREPVTNLTPLATLDADITSGASPLTVTFTAGGIDPDEDGGIDHFDWDYEGDGIIDEQTIFLTTIRDHTYTSPGRYIPRVYVVDVLGGVATAELEILVGDGSNDPPTAAFGYDPLGAAPDDVITFDASTSLDDGTIVQYAWDFNTDGTPDVFGDATDAQIVTNSYSSLGNHRVILRVMDNSGAFAYAYHDVVVGHVPKLTVISNSDYAEVPYGEFDLDASRSTGEEGNITLFEWDLNGDGEFEIQTGVSPFVTAEYDLDDLLNYPGGVVSPLLRATNEIGAVAVTSIVQMQARDADGQPLRDEFGNLILGEDGLPLIEEVTLKIYDDYDEIEDNDEFATTNRLIGPAGDGSFEPTPGGDAIVAVQKRASVGDEIALTRTDPLLGNYVAASLGERTVARVYDTDDEDWYSFKLAEGAHVEIDMHFDGSAETDLIMRLYGSGGTTVLDQSDLAGNEHISYDFRDPGIYYIRVNRFVGPGQDYRLAMVSSPLAYYPEGVADTDNETWATADSLHDPAGSGLLPLSWGRVDPDTDPVDWYFFNYGSPVTTRIRINFAHLIGDLDVFLYDENLSLLGYSNSSNDDENIWRTLPDPGGSVPAYIKVASHGGSATNYTMTVGYPAGAPDNLVASKATADGEITLTWDAPVGGNNPNGYKVYVSDAEEGYYNLLETLNNPNNRSYVHDLTATEYHDFHNDVFWYKVVSTRSGELDSDPSDPDFGFVNDVMPALGLEASDKVSTTTVDIGFYDAPHDVDLGTGMFGIEPAYYAVYADPDGSFPNTLIATFYPGQGTEMVVPALGGIPQHDGEWFGFEWTGGPDWSSNDLAGLNIVFTVKAQAPADPYSSSFASSVTGGFAGLPSPDNTSTGFTATQGLFTDRVKLSWTYTSTIPPDSYQLQRKREFDSGWSNLTDLIPHENGVEVYDYWVTDPGGAPLPAKYRIRCKHGAFYSPWWSYQRVSSYAGTITIDSVFGYASDNGFHGSDPLFPMMDLATPSYVVDGTDRDVYATINLPPTNTIMPILYAHWFERWWDDPADPPDRYRTFGYTGWRTFDRYEAVRYNYITTITFLSAWNRKRPIKIAWRDPCYYPYYATPDSDNSGWTIWEEDNLSGSSVP